MKVTVMINVIRTLSIVTKELVQVLEYLERRGLVLISARILRRFLDTSRNQTLYKIAQSIGAVEYTDYFSAEG